MESDREVLSKIVSERADKIQSEATEQIKHIQENTERELERILPDLMKQIKVGFKRFDVLEVIRNGGIVKTGEYMNTDDYAYWTFSIGNHNNPFPDDRGPNKLDKGRYRITLIMERARCIPLCL